MDHRAIFEMIDAAVFDMENSTCDELMQLLNYVEHVVIEDKKTELFQDRINFICLANCFAAAMERDYNCKQIDFPQEKWVFRRCCHQNCK